MNFILIELNMTCKALHNLPPCFGFDVHIFCCAIIYLFIFLKIIPFWFLTFASISPCAAHVIYIYIYIYIYFSRYSWIDLCFLLSCFVFVVRCDHESQNSTLKPLQDCIYKDVVFIQWYEEVNVWYQLL
jgi:hypothetical protein